MRLTELGFKWVRLRTFGALKGQAEPDAVKQSSLFTGDQEGTPGK
jgi:hypothetical protein